MSLADTIVITGWGHQPLHRIIAVHRGQGRGTFRYEPVAKRRNNDAIRRAIAQARAAVAGAEA